MMKKISLTSDHGAAEVGQSQNVNDPGAFWLHQILQHQEAQELQFFLHFLSAGETAAAFQRDPSYHALQLQQSETRTGSPPFNGPQVSALVHWFTGQGEDSEAFTGEAAQFTGELLRH